MQRLPDGLEFEPLGRLGLRLLVPAGHPLAKRRAPLRQAQLQGQRFVVYEAGSEGRRYTDAVLAAGGVEVVTAAEANSAASIRALVHAGVAPAFVPSLGGGKEPKRRTLPDGSVSFDLSGLLEGVADPPAFGAVRRARSSVGRLGRRFLDEARKLAG
jgi:DNA-binding transcriptional LysR family regulator